MRKMLIAIALVAVTAACEKREGAETGAGGGMMGDTTTATTPPVQADTAAMTGDTTMRSDTSMRDTTRAGQGVNRQGDTTAGRP